MEALTSANGDERLLGGLEKGKLVLVDDPASAAGAAAAAGNRVLGRPGVVDRQLFARFDEVNRFQIKPRRGAGSLFEHELAIRLAGMIDESERRGGLEDRAILEIDAIIRSVVRIADDLAGDDADDRAGVEAPNGVNAKAVFRRADFHP